jgi:membrane dipeptidase
MLVIKIYRIIDLHEDVAYFFQSASSEHVKDFDKDLPDRHADIPKYKKAGIKMIFSAVFPAIRTWDPFKEKMMQNLYGREGSAIVSLFAGRDNLLEQIKIYYRLERFFKDHIKIVSDRADIENLDREEKIMFLISLEGADLLNDPEDLELLFRLGIRSLAVTWNYDNKFGSSCTSRRDYGLTAYGEALVEEANRLGVIIDISHSSRKTSLDVLEISREPVIASHSNYYGRKAHPRNIDDQILEGIKKTRGVIGFTFITSTIGGEGSIDDLVAHIIDVKERFGSDILAIGSDFFGIEKTPRGLEDVTKIPDLLRKLSEKGFSDNEIRGIAYENVLRVLREYSKKWI